MAPAPSFHNENSLFNFIVRQSNGVKGMVDLGLSEVPEQYVQPLKERILKLDGVNNEMITPIDLSKLDGPDHDQVAEQISRAAEELGFFQVVNHGVPVELLEELKVAANNFFGLPGEKKAMYLKGVNPSPLVKYGTSFVLEKEKALEWKDCLSMMYTNDAEAMEQWPQECKDVALEYLRALMEMIQKLMQVLMDKLEVSSEESQRDGLIGMKMVNMNYELKLLKPNLSPLSSTHCYRR